MGVEALGRRHDWVRIQIVLGIAEWENGGPEFGVGPATSGHPWKCLLGFAGIARQPPPGFFPSRASLSPALSWCFFLGRSLVENREALTKEESVCSVAHSCKRCLWQSVFLVNPCVQLRIYVEMFVCSCLIVCTGTKWCSVIHYFYFSESEVYIATSCRLFFY